MSCSSSSISCWGADQCASEDRVWTGLSVEGTGCGLPLSCLSFYTPIHAHPPSVPLFHLHRAPIITAIFLHRHPTPTVCHLLIYPSSLPNLPLSLIIESMSLTGISVAGINPNSCPCQYPQCCISRHFTELPPSLTHTHTAGRNASMDSAAVSITAATSSAGFSALHAIPGYLDDFRS